MSRPSVRAAIVVTCWALAGPATRGQVAEEVVVRQVQVVQEASEGVIVAAQAAADATPPAVKASPHVLRKDKVTVAAFSPDGKALMTVAEDDRQVHFWDVATGEELNRFGVAVTGAVFSADASRVLTWGDDRVARVFDARTGKALRRLDGLNDPITAAALSPDGARAVTSAGAGKAVQIWDTTAGQSLGALDGHAAPVTAVTFAPDGRHVLTATGDVGAAPSPRQAAANVAVHAALESVPAPTPAPVKPLEHAIRLWNLDTRAAVQTVKLPAAAQWAYFSNNGKLVLIGVGNKTMIFDLETGNPVPAPRSPDEAFPPGQLTGDRKIGIRRSIGSAALFDTATDQDLRPLAGPFVGMPLCNAFSADGSRVILGTGVAGFLQRSPQAPGKVYVHDVATGKRLAELAGHPREVQRVAFAPGSATRAFSLDAGKTLFLWALPQKD